MFSLRNSLVIGHTDLRLFLQHRVSYIWLFVLPLAFVYFTGFASRGSGDPSNRHPPVVIENADRGFLGQMLIDEMSAQGLWRVDPAQGGSAGRGLRIPADFTARVLAREPSKVALYQIAGSDEADAALIEARLLRTLVKLNSYLLEARVPAGADPAAAEAALRAVIAKPDPVTLDARFAGKRPVPTGFNFSLPGNVVMYLLMNLLIFGGTSVAAGRRNGVLRRLCIFPVSRGEVIAGQIYGLMLLGGVQTLVFLVAGHFVFGVNFGANLPGVLVVLLVFIWAAASLGVLVGSLFDAIERVVAICVLTSLLLAALGGCWWPIELAPPVFRAIAASLPTGWALSALHQLISFGSDFSAVWRPVLLLVGFGTLANFAAARWFRV